MNPTDSARPRRRAVVSLLALAILTGALAVTLASAGPADAAFAGINGKIAYASYDSTSYNIWVMDADGSNRTYLTSSTEWEQDPVFSPDGSKIAYTRRSITDSNDIWVMNANGTGQTNLTMQPSTDQQPAWSPDGSKIAFTSFRNGAIHNQVYVMNADGSGQTNLSRSAGHEQHPAWSPDGSKIAFWSYRDGNGEIYVMNEDGSAQNNLTQLVDQDADPDWQTVPSADLALSLVASPEEAKAQKPLTYTIRVDNVGPSNAAGVVITDDLPAEQRFVSARPSQGSCQAPPIGTNGTVTCNLGFLLDGQSASAQIVVTVLAQRKSSVSNTATVASATPDPHAANNSATITTPIK